MFPRTRASATTSADAGRVSRVLALRMQTILADEEHVIHEDQIDGPQFAPPLVCLPEQRRQPARVCRRIFGVRYEQQTPFENQVVIPKLGYMLHIDIHSRD